MAVPFDLEHLETKTDVPAASVLEGVLQFSVSETGSLVYVSGSPPSLDSRLVWVSREGSVEPLAVAPGSYNQPRLSPDARRVAVDHVDSREGMQVWVYDLGRDTLAPITFGSVNRHAVWSPDSKRVVFMSFRGGATRIFWQLADGSGGLEELTHDPATTTADILNIPYSFSRNGVLTFVKVFPTKDAEFWALQMGTGKAQRFLQTRTADGAPQLSPDGHWLAYASDESGDGREIYVRAFPGLAGPWQVSTGGGNEPQWNPRGGELFYRSGNRMMAATISTEHGFAVGKPRELFEGDYLTTFGGYARANYDVSPDGQRFLMLKPVQAQAPITEINVVLNWSEELNRLVPSGK
jgi:eukaryotic-like serine/threonine-protein kinase